MDRLSHEKVKQTKTEEKLNILGSDVRKDENNKGTEHSKYEI